MSDWDTDGLINELHEELAEAQLQRDEAEGRLEDAELEIVNLREKVSNLERELTDSRTKEES